MNKADCPTDEIVTVKLTIVIVADVIRWSEVYIPQNVSFQSLAQKSAVHTRSLLSGLLFAPLQAVTQSKYEKEMYHGAWRTTVVPRGSCQSHLRGVVIRVSQLNGAAFKKKDGPSSPTMGPTHTSFSLLLRPSSPHFVSLKVVVRSAEAAPSGIFSLNSLSICNLLLRQPVETHMC